jgi:MoaE-MoaD fusion protein
MTVLLFAGLRDQIGHATLTMPLPNPATVNGLRQALAETHPQAALLLGYSRFAVGSAFVSDDAPLTATDEVAVIPPVSGG